MIKYIVSPSYEITKVMIEEAGDSGRIIICDAASPIFPLDRRELWWERTTVARNLVIDNMHEHEDNEGFFELVYTKVKQMANALGDDLEDARILVYTTKYDAIEDGDVPQPFDVRPMREPIGLEFNALDEPFKSRFGDEFLTYTKPKSNYVGNTTIYVVPTYVDNVVEGSIIDQVRMYGALATYPSSVLELAHHMSSGFMSFIEKQTLAKTITKFFYGFEAKKLTYIGDNIFIADCDKPAWVMDDAPINGNRKMIGYDADIIFIPRDAFDRESPLFHWIIDEHELQLEIENA